MSAFSEEVVAPKVNESAPFYSLMRYICFIFGLYLSAFDPKSESIVKFLRWPASVGTELLPQRSNMVISGRLIEQEEMLLVTPF